GRMINLLPIRAYSLPVKPLPNLLLAGSLHHLRRENWVLVANSCKGPLRSRVRFTMICPSASARSDTWRNSMAHWALNLQANHTWKMGFRILRWFCGELGSRV